MPSPDEVLANLSAIANDAILAAIVWHVVIAAVIVALLAGWRPSQRTSRVAIAIPLASVAAFAFAFGNPFNGLVFTISTIALLALGLRASTMRVTPAAAFPFWIGVAAIAFGWIYPHFLDAHPAVYLYAAPVGLVPCSTLAIVVGFTLLGNGLGSRAWSGALAGLALFYGIFGMLRLGVYLDLGLVVAATVLATVTRHQAAVSSPPQSRARRPSRVGLNVRRRRRSQLA